MVEQFTLPQPPPKCVSPAWSAGDSCMAPPPPDLLRQVLPGMVARGHGIEALCAYLGLTQPALLDLVVELELPTPRDKALRKPGRLGWALSDTSLFVVIWMAGWHVDSLSARFGRSRGSIWSKGRRLGLPPRDRKRVVRPSSHPAAVAGTATVDPVADSVAADPERVCEITVSPDAQRLADPETACCPEALRPVTDQAGPPAAGPAANPASSLSEPQAPIASGLCVERCGQEIDGAVPTATSLRHSESVPPRSLPGVAQADLFLTSPSPGIGPVKRPRAEIAWTRDLEDELSSRWWARQHYRSIARDMGIPPAAIQAKRRRLQLPTTNDAGTFGIFHRDELVDHYDPSVVQENIALAGYVLRECNMLGPVNGHRFWSNGNRTSEEYDRLRQRSNTRVSAAKPKREVPKLHELMPLPWLRQPAPAQTAL